MVALYLGLFLLVVGIVIFFAWKKLRSERKFIREQIKCLEKKEEELCE